MVHRANVRRPLQRQVLFAPAALVAAMLLVAPMTGLCQARLAPSVPLSATADLPLTAAPAQSEAQPPPDRARPAAPAWSGRYHPRYGRWWPGQTLPPDAPTTVVSDPEHYHLRRAPAGYVWLICDGDLVLASSTSGLIVEVIPGGGAG